MDSYNNCPKKVFLPSLYCYIFFIKVDKQDTQVIQLMKVPQLVIGRISLQN